MTTKTLSGVEVKAVGDEHQIEAVFATLGVKDKDGDVTLKGAFQEGAPAVISAYNHGIWKGALPIGTGSIHEVGENVVFKGRFFNTQAAQETREVLKGLGAQAEWSYGFDVVDSERGEHGGEQVRFLKSMKVHEVSPVLIGAGVGTHTVDVKRDYTAQERRDAADNGDAMPDGSFPIHNRSDLHNAIHLAGNAKNPAAARAHIMRRARALGLESMIPADWQKMRLSEQGHEVLADLKAFGERAAEVMAMRAENGGGLGKESVEVITKMREQLVQLDELLTEPAQSASELRQEWLRFISNDFSEE